MTGSSTKLGQRTFKEINVELVLDVPANTETGIVFKVENNLNIITGLKDGSPAADGRLLKEDKIIELQNKPVNILDVAAVLAIKSNSLR